MNPETFNAVARLPIVRDYLEAFPKATGIGVLLLQSRTRVPSRDSKHPPRQAAIVIRGERVAVLRSDAREFPREKLAAAESLLAIFAKHLSDCGARYLLTDGTVDLPAVAGAKAYIGKHTTDSLTADQVARHVGLNRDYLTRLFRRSTGLTLVEYLSHERVERAKDLLADPHVRIADVAFSAGFGSIPHFNRVFRKLTGTNPGAYRGSICQKPDLVKKKSVHA
jgi:AraC-like DNA-binding protein